MARSQRSSSRGLLIALAAAAVPAFLAYWFLKDRGIEEPSTPGAVPPGQPPPAERAKEPAAPKEREDPHAARRDEARAWYDKSFFDERGRHRRLSGAEVHALFLEAEKRGYPAIPAFAWNSKQKSVYSDLLRRHPDDPDANRFYGRVPLADYEGFFELFRRMADAKAIPREFKKFRDEYEERVHWTPRPRAPALGPEEFKRVSRLLDRFRAFDDKMRADPRYRTIYEALARIRIDPLLGQYEAVHVEVPPFVLFYASRDLEPRDDTAAEAGRVEAERKRLEKRLESFRGLITDYLAFFRARWMKPLGLPEFAPTTLRYVWVFGDRESFDEYGKKTGLIAPPSLLGYFDPMSQWVFVYEDTENRSVVETTLAHELTHQLHWHFSQDQKDKGTNHFRAAKRAWFSEGWAEYVGWNARKNGRYEFARVSPGRLDIFHLCRKLKFPIYPVRQLVESHDFNYVEWIRHVRTWYRDQKRKVIWEQVQQIYFAMLYSEGWLFVRFLYNYEGGKYREPMMKFTKAVLRGYQPYTVKGRRASAAQVFKFLFKLKTDADWARLQGEFDGYLEKMLKKYPPTRKLDAD
ncbi:MAG: hypothetical protein ACYTGU_09220 [Planctomycetota bacterium]|jgi:hypothetical protein